MRKAISRSCKLGKLGSSTRYFAHHASVSKDETECREFAKNSKETYLQYVVSTLELE